MNNIDKLLERQKEVNKKCGFELNYDGLILGYYAEVGELCSIIALYEGFKKPKPKDLQKYGGWDLAKETGAVVYESDSDNGYKNYDIFSNTNPSNTIISEILFSNSIPIKVTNANWITKPIKGWISRLKSKVRPRN